MPSATEDDRTPRPLTVIESKGVSPFANESILRAGQEGVWSKAGSFACVGQAPYQHPTERLSCSGSGRREPDPSPWMSERCGRPLVSGAGGFA